MNDLGLSTLENLLKPCPRQDFLSSAWGKSFRHVRGWGGKFSHLLPWPRLNEILEQHRLGFPRLRLAKDGQTLPASSCLRIIQGGHGKAPIPRLLSADLTEHIRGGATLILDAIDEIQHPVRKVAEGLEYFFHERVQVNAYAGFRRSKGFDLHWDDHDVFVLQVFGRKRWAIYGMTRRFPLRADVHKAEKPAHEPLWEDTLEDGDLLYIPRGWWHVAIPLDEPTLHLTVGVHNRTGIDLLRWLTERLRGSEFFRRDLPRFAPSAEFSAHMSLLREELLSIWGERLIDEYLDEYDAMAEPRPAAGLPWSVAGAEMFPAGIETNVRWLAPRPLDFKINESTVEFTCHRKRWRFAPSALPLLAKLNEERQCSVAELCEAAGGSLDQETVVIFISELIENGLVTLVAGNS